MIVRFVISPNECPVVSHQSTLPSRRDIQQVYIDIVKIPRNNRRGRVYNKSCQQTLKKIASPDTVGTAPSGFVINLTYKVDCLTQVLHHRVQLCSNFRTRSVVAAPMSGRLLIIIRNANSLGTIIARVNYRYCLR